ncbi:unnamed protein product, partial [Owenia fusiformis]
YKMATITTNDVQIIGSLNRDEGHKRLATCLGWKAFDEDFDLRSSILLDYLYDNLMFAIAKGFPWSQVLHVLHLVLDVHNDSIGKELVDVIKCYTSKAAQFSDRISENNIKIFTTNYFSTYLTHYKLYKYVFSVEQERNFYSYDLQVDVPIPPLPLKDSKEHNIWEYEKKIADIEAVEEKTKAERGLDFENTITEDHELLSKTFKEGCVPGDEEENAVKISREAIVKLIADAAKAHATAATHSIVANIESVLEDLEFKLEKTSLPRPQALGPPPRFRGKTPLSRAKQGGKSPSREKSPKRKGSGRSTKSKS